MATTIITKTGAGRPANGELERGELGVSPSTGELFTSSNGTDIVPLVDADTPGLPSGTANRQSLSWNGSSWVASSQVLLDITAGQVITAASAPTANNHLTRKDYVDAQITATRNYVDSEIDSLTILKDSAYIDGEIAQILYGNGVQSVVRLGEGRYRVTFSVSSGASTAQTVVCTIQSQVAASASAFILNATQIEVTIWNHMVTGAATPVDGKFFIHRTRG
jgi:hypothetical protein